MWVSQPDSQTSGNEEKASIMFDFAGNIIVSSKFSLNFSLRRPPKPLKPRPRLSPQPRPSRPSRRRQSRRNHRRHLEWEKRRERKRGEAASEEDKETLTMQSVQNLLDFSLFLFSFCIILLVFAHIDFHYSTHKLNLCTFRILMSVTASKNGKQWIYTATFSKCFFMMPDLRLLGWLLPLCCLQSSPSPEPKKKRRRSWKRSCWRRRRARSRPSPPGWASTWGRKSIYIIGGQYISSFAAANRNSDNIFFEIVFETVGIRCGTTCVVGGERQHVTTVYALPNADCYSPPPVGVWGETYNYAASKCCP